MEKRFKLLSDIDRAYNDLYSTLELSGWSHEWLLAEKKKITDELNSRTATGKRRYSLYMAHYASGYSQALWNKIWDKLEFCYRDDNGIIYSTDRKSILHNSTEVFYSSGRGSELNEMERTHLWKHNGKPFSHWSKL